MNSLKSGMDAGGAKDVYAKFAPADVTRTLGPDGSFVLSNPQDFEISERCLGDLLTRWAGDTPDRRFLMEQDAEGKWTGVTYGEALAQVRALAAFMLEQGLGPDRPLLILSGNSVRHGLLTLAAMHVGIPAVPVSVPYSLHDKSLAKLRHIVATTIQAWPTRMMRPLLSARLSIWGAKA